MAQTLANNQGSQYSDMQRREAVTLYSIHGNISRVAELSGIPRNTVQNWKNHADWFHELLVEIRHEMADQHIALYQNVTTKALNHALANIDQLDAKNAVTAAAIATDKARLLSNQPTSIRGDSSTISDLANQFAKLSEQWEEKQARVVATQPKQVDAQTDAPEKPQDDQ